nr:lipocalin family protein [uncultured Flavobacterium sp.]
MRKFILLGAMVVLLFACKSSAPTVAPTAPVAATKLDKKSQVAIKGNWQITDVTYPGSEYFKVNSFNIADSKCFIGSTWNFISNNNKGSMALAGAGCTSFSSSIVWSINNEGMFVLKIVETGVKSKTVQSGFLLKVANQTESTFELIDVMDVAGQKKDIVYHFKKTN